MIRISPFKAIRPTRDKVHLVASRSYVSYTPSALKRKLEENPYSFIHIINPEFGSTARTKANTRERFQKVASRYKEFVDEGILQKENTSAYYLYNQTTPHTSFTGIICGVSTDDYREGKVKIHEQTLTKREKVFCEYLDTCGFNAEPVLLTYRENLASLEAFYASKMLERPEYDFSTTDRHRHRLWIIENPEEREVIEKSFKKLGELYIADGHHRMASSSLLAERRRIQNPNFRGNEMYNFTLALLMSSENLSIEPFHRVISNVYDFSDEELLQKLRKDYDVKPCDHCFFPETKRHFGLRLRSGWYQLQAKTTHESKKAVEHLDAVILTQTVLEPIFNILDQKTDTRIAFIPGKEKIIAMEQDVDKGKTKAIFTLYPVSPEELFEVSDAGETMPPKSTYIEPKLRSGLTIMDLS